MGDIQALIAEIEQEARMTARETGRPQFAPEVYAALRSVPRNEFVPLESRWFALANRPLSIGHGQTISQPFIVALMTDLLDLSPGDKVLEIGTGSGYQAAILSGLSERVVTIEVIPELAASAQQRLAHLGYANVEVHCADGRDGWPLDAPYDAIIVTAAADDVPPVLLSQLREGGRLVIPLGNEYGTQTLYVYTKTAQGIEERRMLDVRFVPLVYASKTTH